MGGWRLRAQVASGALDCCVRLWQCKGRLFQQAVLGSHPSAVTSLAFNSAGTRLASSSAGHAALGTVDALVKVWRVPSGELLLQVPHCFAAVWCPPPPPPSGAEAERGGGRRAQQARERLAAVSHHRVRIVSVERAVAAAGAGAGGAAGAAAVLDDGLAQAAQAQDIFCAHPLQHACACPSGQVVVTGMTGLGRLTTLAYRLLESCA